jgi:ribosomal subunit interface protein
MKLTIQHFEVRSTHSLDSEVEERILALQPRLQIDEANVRLEHQRQLSPPYGVHIHLVTPGPDVVAEAHDHTLAAAMDKVILELEDKINRRTTRHRERLRNQRAAAARGRSSRSGR